MMTSDFIGRLFTGVGTLLALLAFLVGGYRTLLGQEDCAGDVGCALVLVT